MLKLTKKADYGLMALKFLAEHAETPSLSAKDIAEAYGIPKVGTRRSQKNISARWKWTGYCLN